MPWKIPEEFRLPSDEFGLPGDLCGAFRVPSLARQGYELIVLASPGGDIGGGRVVTWEHVSVHAAHSFVGDPRTVTPTWERWITLRGYFGTTRTWLCNCT